MARRTDVIAAFLACITVASATVIAPFPHGKTTVYRYDTIVSASTSEGVEYSSQFVLRGTLDVTHDTTDSKFKNAYNVAFSNVATDMHNGKTISFDGRPGIQSLDNKARAIQNPFLIIYNTNGTLHGVKFGANEPEWSKNMKMAMASTLQLDLPNINVENLKNEPSSFVTQENTIHGDCAVMYNIHPKVQANSNMPEAFRVNKTFSPMDCSGFAVHDFKNIDIEQCMDNKQQRTATDSSRDVEVEKHGDGILIKKLEAYGVTSVYSFTGLPFPSFVITNTTFELLQVKDKSENPTPLGNFIKSPMIHDVSYGKPQRTYVPNAAVDVTQGRHIVNVRSRRLQLKRLLIEAIDYLDQDQLGQKKMDFNSAQTINKILDTMRYMDTYALQNMYNTLTRTSPTVRSKQLKNILIGVASQVGTPASCNFTYNIIRQNHLPLMTAIDLLAELSVSVRVPTLKLLAQMEGLSKFDSPILPAVRKAGILSFASLIYRTFKYVPNPENSAVLSKYLHDFFDHVKNEPTYEMKMTYLMAMKNVHVGKIYDILEPIINGKLVLSEHSERLRLMAIWAIDEAVKEDYEAATRVLLPVMMDEKLPTKLRIAAYEILMNQAPDEKSALDVHQYVINNGNEHFNNYHYTNLNSIIQSVNQCKTPIRIIARSILATMEYPPESHKNIHYPLSAVHSVRTLGWEFVDAEKLEFGIVLNEFTGEPEVVQVKHVATDYDGALNDFEIKVHIEGHQNLMGFITHNFFHDMTPVKIQEFLKNVAKTLPAMKELNIDIVEMRNGRVFMAYHYNIDKLDNINDCLDPPFFSLWKTMSIDYQKVVYNRLYERQITTDIGVPLIVANRNPVVNSLKIAWEPFDRPSTSMKLEVELKTWKAGDFSMSVYNPMKDVWHAARSIDATEMTLPFRTIMTLGKRMGAIKFSFPEDSSQLWQLPSRLSTVRYLIQGKHFVTVNKEGSQALMESCKTCNHHKSVIYDPIIGSRIQGHKETLDINGTGLKYSKLRDDCHYRYLSNRYHVSMPQWKEGRIIHKISNNWYDLAMQSLLNIRQEMRYEDALIYTADCSSTMSIYPSTENSISQLLINIRSDNYDPERNETNFQVLHAEKNKLNITLETTARVTNTSSGSLNLNIDIDADHNHLCNKASLKFTWKNPNEKDLKICIDMKKNYPTVPADNLEIYKTNEKIYTAANISFGYTDKDECVRDENIITIKMKAQLSLEQTIRAYDDEENSACSKDTINPLYANPNNLIPRTKNCLDEAIRYTTLRKYNIDVNHEKLSPDVATYLYHFFTNITEPRVNGNFKIQAEFPIETNNLNLQLMTNSGNFTKQNYPLTNQIREGQGPIVNSLWNIFLDNSRYNLQYLDDYIGNKILICTVYPKIVQTGDYENLPYDMPSDSWTLVSGDHVNKRFAIFAKQTRPNYLSFMVFIAAEKIHFYTRESDNVVVAKLDGAEMPTDKDFRLPLEDYYVWNVKASKDNDHFAVYDRNSALTLLVGPNYISVVFKDDLQGNVSGLCGHLNGYYQDGKPAVYSIPEFE